MVESLIQCPTCGGVLPQKAAARVLWDTSVLRVDGKRIHFTPNEAIILSALMEHPGIVVSRDRLISILYDHKPESDVPEGVANLVAVFIHYLRKKLVNKRLIGTVYGRGYIWRPDGDGEMTDQSLYEAIPLCKEPKCNKRVAHYSGYCHWHRSKHGSALAS